MNPIKLLLALPVIALLASCQTTRTEVWRKHPAPTDAMVEKFVGANASSGFVAPQLEIMEKPLTRDGKQPQVLITSKFIDSTATKVVKKHDVMSDPAFQVTIRRLSQTEGIDLMSAPSVVTSIGQQAKIEVVREMKFKGDAFDEVQNLGVSLDIKPTILTNGRVHLSGKATVREVDTPEPSFGGSNMAIAVQSSETYIDVVMKDGQTAQIICRDNGSPGQRIMFVTARLIDPSGQPAKIAR